LLIFGVIHAELLIFLGSVFLGVVCSLFLNRYFVAKKENKIKLSNDVKSKLDNLYLEKSVALEAMNKINQYFGEKKIDELEKDRLLLKYVNLLNHYNEQIVALQPVLEAQEIFEFRKQLYSLISDSIAKLDERLSDFSNNFNYFKEEGDAKKLGPVSEPMTAEMQTTSKPDIINNGNDSLLPFAKSKSDVDLLDVDRNSITTPPPSYFSNYAVDKKNENNDNAPNMSGTKKDTFENANIEEMDKIQKDILNILKRLENHDDQM
jgi:hypothetical protein